MRQRHDVALLPDRGDQRPHNAEAGRQPHHEGRAPPRHRREGERRAEVVQAGRHDIEPDATAGDIRHRGRRAEAWPSQHGEQSVVIERGIGFENSLRHRPRGDGPPIDAPAIVTQFEHHRIPIAAGLERHRAGRALAQGAPHVGGLEAVVDGVPQQVDQRLGQLIEHGAVHLEFLALHLHRHLFAELPGEVAHDRRDPLEHLAQRREADMENPVLQRVESARHHLRRTCHRRQGVPLGVALEFLPSRHQPAEVLEERIEAIEVDADDPCRRGGLSARGGLTLGCRGGLAADGDLVERRLEVTKPGPIRRVAAIAHGDDRALGRVGQFGDRLVFERGGHALDGVEGAEDLVGGGALGGVIAPGREGPARAGQQRARLRREERDVPRPPHLGHPARTRWTASRTRAGWNGLTTKSLAPA